MGRIGAAEEHIFYCGTGSPHSKFRDPCGKPAIGEAPGGGMTKQVVVEKW